MVFLLSLILMLIVVSIMSIGVMMGRKPIAGSCGGIKNLGDGAACEICGGDPNRCENDNSTVEPSVKKALAYDATKPPSNT